MALQRGLLTAASHLLFSSEQVQETAGIADDGEALKRLAALTPHSSAATRGPHGTIWLNETGALEETPAFPVEAVDTLGAGDVFHGAFTLRLAEGGDVREALRFAAAAAALKCTRHGGGLAAPQRIEVEELLRRHGVTSHSRDVAEIMGLREKIFLYMRETNPHIGTKFFK